MFLLLAAIRDGERAAQAEVAKNLADLGVSHGPESVPHHLFVEVVAPFVASESRLATSRGLRYRLVWRNRVFTTRATADYATSMEGNSSAEALALAEAGQLEPETAAAVLDSVVARIDYCLHELPAGVLFDTNGASSAQLGDLLDWVGACRKLAESQGLHHRYSPALGRAAFFFDAYRDYLETGRYASGFEGYLLERFGAGWQDLPKG